MTAHDVIIPSENTSLLGQNNNNGNNNEHDHDHTIELERKRRCRMTLALVVGTVFMMLFATLAVWTAHFKAGALIANQRGKRAAEAITSLNNNLRTQSKKILKGCESTLLVMRHCEKLGPHVTDAEGNQHCSYVGFERARFVATLFGSTPKERWPAPLHLFALAPDRADHWNFREWETLYPVSKKLEIDIDVVGRYGFQSEYFDLLRSGALCGQVAVVSWKHEFIPELVTELGCGVDQGCPNVYPEDSFDEVWQLKFVFNPNDDSKANTEDEHGIVVTNERNADNITNNYPDPPGNASSENATASNNNDTGDNDAPAEDEKDSFSKTEEKQVEVEIETGTHGADDEKKKEAPTTKSSSSSSSNAVAADGGDAIRFLKSTKLSKKKLKIKKKKKHHHRLKTGQENLLGWGVYATVLQQNFDPLAFSKVVGDYPEGGSPRGGRWAGDEI